MDNKNLPPEQISESRSSGHTSQLTDAEALQLQQLAQLSYWNQLNRQSESSQPTAAGDERRSVPAQWHLLGHHSLYSWQRKALDAWEAAGNRGIIKVVTGAGKTMLALGAMERLQHRSVPDLRVAIVVPTLVLLEQWREVFLSQSNLPPGSIATLGGSVPQRFDEQVRVIIAVINTAAKKLAHLVKQARIGDRLLLVVDECHRAGAAERRHLFETERAYSIGLSATPERDDREPENLELGGPETPIERPLAGDDVLLSELGPIIYEMNYNEAVKLGVLAPFTIQHYGLTLTPAERNRYDKLSREITDIRRDLESRNRKGLALLKWCRSSAGQRDPRAQRFLSLTSERKIFLYRAEARLSAVQKIIKNVFETYDAPRIIIFHESIDEVMLIFDSLRQIGIPVVGEHSEFPDKLRSESIRLFRAGIAKVIVSAKSLIEGFNVPSADVGIIAAASGSVRQRVQTLGRLLRPDPSGKKRARLVVLYMTHTVDEMIYEKADWESFVGAERNEYYHWSDVRGGQPTVVGVPPRRPPVKDSDIKIENLEVGADYPGILEGSIYSVDTQGAVTDESGRLQQPTPALRKTLQKWLQHGGRFAVTPSQRFLLKSERSLEGPKIVFIGKAPVPLFSTETKASHLTASLAAGDLYPFTPSHTKRFSVLQRDTRLIAMKKRGAIKFVERPEKIADSNKADQLRAIIAHLHATYQSGKQISKIFVTENGDVIYPFQGQYYFAGKAPEGKEGFLLE